MYLSIFLLDHAHITTIHVSSIEEANSHGLQMFKSSYIRREVHSQSPMIGAHTVALLSGGGWWGCHAANQVPLVTSLHPACV